MKTIEKGHGAKWGLRGRAAFFAIVIGVVTIALWHMKASKDDITGTVSKAEPPIEQDDTPAHPYADASQCPPSTDVVIWPRNDRPIPSIPSGISVCFVGTQSFNNAGPDLHVRGRNILVSRCKMKRIQRHCGDVKTSTELRGLWTLLTV